jgi:hypothetical protein
MANENTIPLQTAPVTGGPKQNILEQSLGDILQNNPQAQKMIMQSMGISQEKFQQMLTSVQQNNMMHMKIGDLFKSGIVNQAVQQNSGKQPQNGEALIMSSGPMQFVQKQQMQVTPEQLQQMQNGTLSPLQLVQQSTDTGQKTSFIDKLKSWFK